MKICPKCSSFANDDSNFCPRCGSNLDTNIPVSNHSQLRTEKNKNKVSASAIVATVIGTIALCLYFSYFSLFVGTVGIIVGIIAIALSRSDRSRFISIIGISFSVLAFITFFAFQREQANNEKPNEQKEEIAVETPSPTVEPTEAPINYKEVFLYDLILNSTSYVNQYVETSFSIHYCYPKENDGLTEIASEYTDYDLTGEMDNIFIYLDGLVEYEMDQYITVRGRFVYKDSRYCIIDAEVTDIGSQSEKSFQDGLIIYTHYRNEELQASKESFIASCVEVSYDDLLRYPETYQDVPIKLTIVASDVKADGWIFKGDILAEYQGGDLIVFDDREVREPRLVNGDKVTVYATGDGLGKMKIKEDRFIYEKTVDDYNVPQISIKYTEWDKAFTEMDSSSKASDDGDLYDEGKRAGDDLAETLGEIDWDENKEDAREAGEELAEYINEIIGAE